MLTLPYYQFRDTSKKENIRLISLMSIDAPQQNLNKPNPAAYFKKIICHNKWHSIPKCKDVSMYENQWTSKHFVKGKKMQGNTLNLL